MSNRKNILLLGSYGRGNIGDDAFLLAALKLFGEHHLFINSSDDGLLPEAIKGKVTTIATAGQKDLLRKLRIFMSLDHIIYCGGDLWVELYGDRFPRQSLYKMVIVNLVARLFGKRVHYVGCGIGRLKGYSLLLARLSAGLANNVIVREPRSAHVLGLRRVRVLPDLVTNLDVTHKSKHHKGKFVIGVSILYYLPNPPQNFPKMIAALSQVLNYLPARNYKVVLFPMLASPGDDHDDVWASGQLEATLPNADVTIFSGRGVDQYIDALDEVDLLIGTRLHANILAMLAGVPSIGISYRPKVAQFFAMNGLSHYCIELDELKPETLAQKIQMVHENIPQAKADFARARERNLAERVGYQDLVNEL